ncbi:hypothetical protein [Mesonia maritima]|uniref:Uncharacterized protein n=1 Tax=Mesonia maritima TaxID=1793873 RepID=A0ABU1K5X5_9FLAO|nr:hypothetical protein [Mesonia maritima]MDR6299912.1 hypothetical protein [Mesonia maritima]
MPKAIVRKSTLKKMTGSIHAGMIWGVRNNILKQESTFENLFENYNISYDDLMFYFNIYKPGFLYPYKHKPDAYNRIQKGYDGQYYHYFIDCKKMPRSIDEYIIPTEIQKINDFELTKAYIEWFENHSKFSDPHNPLQAIEIYNNSFASKYDLKFIDKEKFEGSNFLTSERIEYTFIEQNFHSIRYNKKLSEIIKKPNGIGYNIDRRYEIIELFFEYFRWFHYGNKSVKDNIILDDLGLKVCPVCNTRLFPKFKT